MEQEDRDALGPTPRYECLEATDLQEVPPGAPLGDRGARRYRVQWVLLGRTRISLMEACLGCERA